MSYQSLPLPENILQRLYNLVTAYPSVSDDAKKHLRGLAQQLCGLPVFVEKRSVALTGAIMEFLDGDENPVADAISQRINELRTEEDVGAVFTDRIAGKYGEWDEKAGFMRVLVDTKEQLFYPLPPGAHEHVDEAQTLLGVDRSELPAKAAHLVGVHAHFHIRDGRIVKVEVPYGSGSLDMASVRYTQQTLDLAGTLAENYFGDDSLLDWDMDVECVLQYAA